MNHRPTPAVAAALLTLLALALWIARHERESDSLHLGVLPGGVAAPARGSASVPIEAPEGARDRLPIPLVGTGPVSASAPTPGDPVLGAVWLHAVWVHDGTPASDVVVEFAPKGERAGFAASVRHLTDAAGTLQLENVLPGEWVAWCELGGRVAFEVRMGETNHVVLELPSGPRVRGVVLEPDGRPAAGALVRFTRSIQVALGGDALRCDDQGQFDIRSAGEATHVIAHADGFAPSPLYPLPRATDLPKDQAVELRLTLGQGGARLRGRVLDAQQNALAGAQVAVAGSPGAQPFGQPAAWHGAPMVFRSDARGEFDVESLPHGELAIQCRAAGFAPLNVRRAVEPGGTLDIELQLTPAAAIEGVVRLRDGRPPRHGSIGFGNGRRVEAAPDGSYRVEDLAPGTITLEADAGEEGSARTTLQLVAGAVERWDPVLEPPVVLHGRLLDADGFPLGGWGLFANWPGQPERGTRSTATGPDGRFRFACPDTSLLTLTVSRELSAPRPIMIRDGIAPGVDEVVLQIHERLLPDAWIVAESAASHAAALLAMRVDGEVLEPPREAAFDGGRARLGPFVAGRYSTWVRFDGELPQRLDEFELQSGATHDLGTVVRMGCGSIEFSVSRTDGGRSGRVQVTLNDASGLELWSRVLEGQELSSPPSIEGVPAGTYRMYASEPATLAFDEIELDVDAGETMLATLVLGGG